ncbi:MAG: Arm DNA-binding domain-containing protein, partial [Actinomycetia bacterium]|nr:Arm DNA-binding domain-containing protein [Actinomycetes bacterium]
MKGHVRRNGKTYQYIHDAPRTRSGKRKQVTKSGFRYKKDAQKALTKAMANRDAENLDPHVGISVTVGKWIVDSWLPAYDMSVRRSTIGTYKGIVTNHI